MSRHFTTEEKTDAQGKTIFYKTKHMAALSGHIKIINTNNIFSNCNSKNNNSKKNKNQNAICVIEVKKGDRVIFQECKSNFREELDFNTFKNLIEEKIKNEIEEYVKSTESALEFLSSS